ncbi:hypothetical protein BJ508DRAFT_48045 [Ascobolus immersus RN42]|uniref:BTB domain-containing protein n=1 Tax=Ascobolus immersus RN42 TaxID=1160509 RepID=A0A3N4HL90_ASCIM|nr:hypothetical protein BJ508DRAFT_48045 [Ascobolus immersus RN42]
MSKKRTKKPYDHPLPSSLSTSPTIAVHLVLPGYSKYPTKPPTNDSQVTKKRKIEQTVMEKAATRFHKEMASQYFVGTYHLHVSQLVEQSEYFRGLVAFDGIEVKENSVTLEYPFGHTKTTVASVFGCFVDYLYTGSYDFNKYNFTPSAGNPIPIAKYANIHANYTAMLYVLADRLLADRLKQETLKRMHNLLLVMWFDKPGLHTFFKWESILRMVRIVFDGTALRRKVASSKHSHGLWNSEKSTAAKAVEASGWLGKEPMRKLVAAFLAGCMAPPEEDLVSEGWVRVRQIVVDQFPELNVLMLGYIMSGERFGNLTLAKLGIGEVGKLVKEEFESDPDSSSGSDCDSDSGSGSDSDSSSDSDSGSDSDSDSDSDSSEDSDSDSSDSE